MNQEDINDLLKKPEWRKLQSNSYFSEKAISAMRKATEWLENDRWDDGYINEEWYWEMKELLKGE